jgi:acyl-CoA thioesterase FadM
LSGLLRNLLTLLQAFLAREVVTAQSRVIAHFRVTPFDCGISTLKSDKYLQFAEAAQVDYLIRTRLFHKLRHDGLRFVNASQLVKFSRPVGMFQRVRIETAIIFADNKCAYFSHDFFLGDHKHAEVLVKMKFKKGSITVPPGELIDHVFTAKPACVDTWDLALEAMRE